MTKVSLVLYYWILIAATLLFAKTAGLADNNTAVVKILIVVTILYIGVAMISRSRGRAMEARQATGGQNRSSAAPGAKRKKKHK